MEPRDLSEHTVYRAGRGSEEVARDLGMDPDDLVELGSNENMHGPSPRAVDALRSGEDHSGDYPKASHSDLVDCLAEEWDVSSEQVWLGNGANGALDFLARAMLEPDDAVLVPAPGFAYYPMSARAHRGTVQEYTLSKAEEFAQTAATILDDYAGERIVYLTTPHNPTGSEIEVDAVREIAEQTEDGTLVVVDEAYGEFSAASSAGPLLDERGDVAILRTFSKAYGLAGARLGYALVPDAWADAYARIRSPFPASELACRAGLAALDDDEHLTETVDTARWAREYMYDHLDAPTWESGGNFVLVDVGDGSAVADAARHEGVIVRDCTSFGLPECIRITCGAREETKRAVESVNEILAEEEPR